MNWSCLIGNRIVFEPLSVSIVNDLHAYASDEKVSKFIGWPLMNSIDDSKKYVNKLFENEKNETHQYASIVLKETGKHIGTLMLFDFDKEAKRAEIGFVLHQDYWNKGFVSESVQMLVAFLRDEKKLNKLCARVVSSNIGSSKVLEKVGFKLEGTLIDQYFIEDQYYNCLQYGLLFN